MLTMLILSCNKEELKPTPFSETEELLENPTGSMDFVLSSEDTRPGETADDSRTGCGGYLSGNSSTPGFQVYPLKSFYVSGCSGSQTRQVTVKVQSLDVPNRFRIKNSSGQVVASSNNWLGFANYPGPWGFNISGPGQEDITFTTNSGGVFFLEVETVVSVQHDTWLASISCSCLCNVSYSIINNWKYSEICWSTNCPATMCQIFDVDFVKGSSYNNQQISVNQYGQTCVRYYGRRISNVTLTGISIGGCPSNNITNGSIVQSTY